MKVDVHRVDAGVAKDKAMAKVAAQAAPGRPAVMFYRV